MVRADVRVPPPLRSSNPPRWASLHVGVSEGATAGARGRPAGWRWLTLGAVLLLTAALRVWLVLRFPEPDADAPGHLGIAAAVLNDPFNVQLHWVWPPGYHFLLAALLRVGFTGDGVRLFNGALAALIPVLVWRHAERVLEPSAADPTRLAPFFAGLLCAVMPVVNILGTSAQQETVFTLLVIGVAWSSDVRRFALSGVLLALACMVRYEAWGGVGLLVGLRFLGFFPALTRRLPEPLARACRLPLVLIVPSILVTAAWFLAHRLADGSFFGFIQEIFRYTAIQREVFLQDSWGAVVAFAVWVPYYMFGLSLVLFFLGLRRAFRVGSIVPVGIYLFLMASYASKSALSSARYYESLTPFVCFSAACGATVLAERWRHALLVSFAIVFAHVVWLLLLYARTTYPLGF
jgi:hypothetical protein